MGTGSCRIERHSLVNSNCVVAIKDSCKFAGCIRIYPMPPADQSILRKTGFELSYRRRRVDVMMLSLHCSNKSMSVGDQASIGKTLTVIYTLKTTKLFNIRFKPWDIIPV